MRDEHLGDSLDMSKRVVICLLRNDGFRLLICPLPSGRSFREDIYRSCLGLQEQDQVFNPEQQFRGAQQRPNHLSALRRELAQWAAGKRGIAMLDPDKGVRAQTGKNKNMFITVPEVNDLVAAAGRHVVAVYHHKGTGSLSCQEIVERLKPAIAYDFGAAHLCFISAEKKHLQRIRRVFEMSLNPSRMVPRGHGCV
jgi:hypothetical protein